MESLSEFYSPDIQAYRDKVEMLSMMSTDDPEFWVANTQTPVVASTESTIATHHAYHAKTLRLRANALVIKHVSYHGYYEDPSGGKLCRLYS
ncbi:hypothetical protein [Psychroflexus sediminis]|uniref:Uncharacterized protein n=1 Tax=Psychroflexus sediminis TaxID=470826 RepID=A0A1G7VYX0_9FLAO|nr:hypothetical protein [Psychroflexus sediminis]SDG64942.1 hypothetical protein SAMN04488027_104267 [Psychroflexus sediminis]